MPLTKSFKLHYLVDQLLRTLSRTRPEVASLLRPPLRTRDLVALGAMRDADGNIPAIANEWFRYHDGQADGAPPLHARRSWRALSAEEAMAAWREQEPDAKHVTWLPLFRDAGGHCVCSPIGGGALHRLGGEREDLPELHDVLLEMLEDLGWTPPEPSAPPASLGAMLEELDRLLVEDARGWDLPVLLRPPATSAALALLASAVEPDALPAELALWFSWHDGETPAPPGTDSFSLFGAWSARLLSVADALAARAELAVDDGELRWEPAWVPILRGLAGGYFAYVLGGEAKASVLFCDAERESASISAPSLAHFVWDCVERRRHSVARRKEVGSIPDDYVVSASQRWVLALGGILTQVNRDRFDLLGGTRRGHGAVLAKEALAGWWDVLDATDAREKLDKLLVAHEARYLAPDASFEGAEVPDGVAFDLGRVHFVAGHAYTAMLFDAGTAWQYCLRAARVAQRIYRSWSDFGAAYGGFLAMDGLRLQQDNLLRAAAHGDTAVSRHDARYARGRDDAAAAVAALLAPGGAWAELA